MARSLLACVDRYPADRRTVIGMAENVSKQAKVLIICEIVPAAAKQWGYW